MTPALKRSLAARAAASKNGNSESEQSINVRALLREIGGLVEARRGPTGLQKHTSAMLAELEPKVPVESNDTTAAHGTCRRLHPEVWLADLSIEVRTMSLDTAQYRKAMGCFATGVTIITVDLDGGVHGMTANAFTSVSLDPMLVLVCVDLAREHTPNCIPRSALA